ncbi:alpha/beta hydrolase [Aestuariivirga sp.]|uniref:alpha/beta hydrolase n=1 Tax=Aestuariivirga sp. TaxID=2650926 RepID=UPI0035933EB8
MERNRAPTGRCSSAIVHDSKVVAVPVLFTWASRGQASEYVYDGNSATAAGDHLEHTLPLPACAQSVARHALHGES